MRTSLVKLLLLGALLASNCASQALRRTVESYLVYPDAELISSEQITEDGEVLHFVTYKTTDPASEVYAYYQSLTDREWEIELGLEGFDTRYDEDNPTIILRSRKRWLALVLIGTDFVDGKTVCDIVCGEDKRSDP